MKRLNREQFNILKEAKLDNAKRNDLGVAFSFVEIHPKLLSWHSALIEIVNGADESFSNRDLNSLNTWIAAFNRVVQKVYSFNPADPELPKKANEMHQDIINEANSEFDTMAGEAMRMLAFVRVKKLASDEEKEKLSALIEAAQGRMGDIETKYKQCESDIAGSRAKMREMTQQAKDLSSKTVTAKYAILFSEEEGECRKKVKFWWVVVILSAAVLIGAAIIMYDVLRPIWMVAIGSGNYSVVTSIVVLKVFILSIIGTIMSQAVKHLNAYSHLATLYKYRAIALESFQVFLNASNDPKVKDALLVQVAGSIYQNNVSGFLSKDDSGDSSELLSVARRVIEK